MSHGASATTQVEHAPPYRHDRHVGELLSNTYRIARRIGSGGMAEVYEVEHLRLGSRFAAKILRSRYDESATARRLLREARALSRLRSDHIVCVFDVSEPGAEVSYYVMELLDGQDLRTLLTTTPELPIARAAKIVADACLGVSAAHAAGLVHRDLKPENLFVTHRDTGEELCKLLDFGVAKGDDGTSTEHGALIGTVRYMSPEQIAHSGAVSPLADVYGLGAILYECLAGKPLYVADSVERLLYKILHEEPASLRSRRPSVPNELEIIVRRALAREPSNRFPSASAMAEALWPFAGRSAPPNVRVTEGTGTIRALPVPPRENVDGRPRRTMLFAAGVLAFTGTAFVSTSGLEPQAHHPPAPFAASPQSPSAPAPRSTQAEPFAHSTTPGSAALQPSAAPLVSRAKRRVNLDRAGPPTAPSADASVPERAPLLTIDVRNPYGP